MALVFKATSGFYNGTINPSENYITVTEYINREQIKCRTWVDVDGTTTALCNIIIDFAQQIGDTSNPTHQHTSTFNYNITKDDAGTFGDPSYSDPTFASIDDFTENTNYNGLIIYNGFPSNTYQYTIKDEPISLGAEYSINRGIDIRLPSHFKWENCRIKTILEITAVSDNSYNISPGLGYYDSTLGAGRSCAMGTLVNNNSLYPKNHIVLQKI